MFRFVRPIKLRFSLAACLLAVALVALFLGDAAMNARRVQNFRKLVADLNGHLFCRHELLELETMDGLADQVDEAASPASWRDLLPPGWFAEPVHIDLFATHCNDEDLKFIRKVSELEELSLGGTEITDRTLYLISELSRLKGLGLEGTFMTDTGLEHLTILKNLEALFLNNTNVTDVGLKHLHKLPALRALDLTGCNVSTEGIAELQERNPNCTIRW